jgi:hypothetical protein
MIQVQAERRIWWGGVAWLSALAVALAVAVWSVSAAVLLGLAATLALAGSIMFGTRQTPRADRRRAMLNRRERRSVIALDGSEHTAIVMPVESADGYQMVLTAEGFGLADEGGKVIYRIR